MKKLAWLLIGLLFLFGCTSYGTARLRTFPLPGTQSTKHIAATPEMLDLINEQGATVQERIETPPGFERVEVEQDSFGSYLRSFPLNAHGSPVRYFDGDVKTNEVYVAVFNIDIGEKDLQQCADAMIRLRAEYLYQRGEYDKIHFNFTNGFRADYSKWRGGSRIVVKGNDASWVDKNLPSTDYESFRKYLDMVLAYAGTLSLSKELKRVPIEDMQIGDVFLMGGSPGHGVIVVDMAENKQTGERLFLLAQSYMPAQDIQLLKNPLNDDGNPWYTLKPGEELTTPEWSFSANQLMRFE